MNFMAKSRGQGFYGEDQDQDQDQNQHHNPNNNQREMMMMMMMSNSSSSSGGKQLPFSCSSSSPSSSPSQPHKSLLPLAFHQHQRGSSSWLENKFDPQRLSSAADEISSSRTGGAANLDLMDASPSAVRSNSDDDAAVADHSDDVIRLAAAGGGGGASTASAVGVVEREHMFDKVVTPSDVGKLNRLVIPKQHAEKYFPLDSSTNEKGLLLNFEDRNGKPWRFRYSYWNSSQSYVMTKGWSRFVKEKKLDAGDIVSFQRGVGELGKDRLFIDWRRRPNHAPSEVLLPQSQIPLLSHQQYLSFHRSTHPSAAAAWSPLFLHQQQQPPPPQVAASRDYSHIHQQQHHYPNASGHHPHYSPSSYGFNSGTGGPYGYNSTSTHHMVNHLPSSNSIIYLRSGAAHVGPPQHIQAGMMQLHSGSGGGDGGGGTGGAEEPMPMVFESVPVVQGKAAAKRLRLFGVNMDCPPASDYSSFDHDQCHDHTILSSTAVPHHHAAATTMARPPYISSSSSSSSPLQLRLYNSSSSSSPVMPPVHDPDKADASNKSFDLDI